MFRIVYICMFVVCIQYILQSIIHKIIILMNNTTILSSNNSCIKAMYISNHAHVLTHKRSITPTPPQCSLALPARVPKVTPF